MQYIMAFDQGTTSSRCILFNHKGKICGMAQKNIRQSYPKAGWVEHNPMEILSSQLEVAKPCYMKPELQHSKYQQLALPIKEKLPLCGTKTPESLSILRLYGNAEELRNK